MQDIFISVVIPCRNPGVQIVPAIRSVLEVLQYNYNYYEIVIVDDGSTDDTTEHIQKLLQEADGLRLLRLPREHGADTAIAAGLDSAIGDYVIVMDPLVDPPAMITDLINECQRNPGVYYGIPHPVPRRNWLRCTLSKIFDCYCRVCLQIDIQRNSLLFRVFPRAAVNTFTQSSGRNRILRLITANLGMPVHYFKYTPQLQKQGLSPTRTLADDINMAFDILVATSRHPLRLVSRLGLLLAMANVLYALYIVAIFLFKQDVAEGWVTLSMQNAVMFFALFMLLTLLSEYIGNGALTGANNPLYTALEEHNSSVLVDEAHRRNIVTHATSDHT
ncbi:MAG: glycosyltransferase family 2 protein [Kiritimatiellia bacterium]